MTLKMAWLTLLIHIKLIAHCAVIYASTLFNIQIILTSFYTFFLYSLYSCISFTYFLMKLDPVNELPHQTPEIRKISTSMIAMHPWLESHECYVIQHLGV